MIYVNDNNISFKRDTNLEETISVLLTRLSSKREAVSPAAGGRVKLAPSIGFQELTVVNPSGVNSKMCK